MVGRKRVSEGNSRVLFNVTRSVKDLKDSSPSACLKYTYSRFITIKPEFPFYEVSLKCLLSSSPLTSYLKL